jgi:CheY-like chemotaxis protein
MSGAKLILVVDDDAFIQDALREALEDEGYAVIIAANGAEALRKVRSGCRPDAILLDHMMPVMDGPTFAAEVSKDPGLAGMPIILITADARAKEKAVGIGLHAFLRKPLKLEELLSTIESAFSARRVPPSTEPQASA